MNTNSQIPFNLRALRVPTAAAERLFNVLSEAIKIRRRGIAVISGVGSGLTTALQLAQEGLSLQKPSILVVRCTGFSHDPKELWRYFVAGESWPSGVRNESPESRTRLIRRLCQKAGDLQTDLIALLVDRAHDMDARHFLELARLEDDLAHEGLQLLVCLGGNTHLEDIERSLLHDGVLEPTTRYFSTKMFFHGVTNIEELAIYLSWFDVQGPKNGGSPITRHCFRTAYDSGWRLTGQARALWSQLSTFLSPQRDIEMQPLHEIVCSILEHGLRQPTGLPPTDIDWLQAVERSNLPALREFDPSTKIASKERNAR